MTKSRTMRKPVRKTMRKRPSKAASKAASSPAAKTVPLSAIAKTIRSKNAGVDKITFDIIFRSRADYDRVRRSGALSRQAVAQLYNLPPGRISDYVEFDPALAIKFSIFRERPSGSVGDADIFGSQQYGPLLGVEVPSADG